MIRNSDGNVERDRGGWEIECVYTISKTSMGGDLRVEPTSHELGAVDSSGLQGN